jgi:hypothetical protein
VHGADNLLRITSQSSRLSSHKAAAHYEPQDSRAYCKCLRDCSGSLLEAPTESAYFKRLLKAPTVRAYCNSLLQQLLRQPPATAYCKSYRAAEAASFDCISKCLYPAARVHIPDHLQQLSSSRRQRTPSPTNASMHFSIRIGVGCFISCLSIVIITPFFPVPIPSQIRFQIRSLRHTSPALSPTVRPPLLLKRDPSSPRARTAFHLGPPNTRETASLRILTERVCMQGRQTHQSG